MMMMFTPETHLPTSGQHGLAPSGTPPPAQPPPPPQTRETQSHSAPNLPFACYTPIGHNKFVYVPNARAADVLQYYCTTIGQYANPPRPTLDLPFACYTPIGHNKFVYMPNARAADVLQYYCTTIGQYANPPRPTLDLSFACYTPYNIGNNHLVYYPLHATP